jgi:predicted TIM-barrel fold metal-dependent hydrolase
MPEVAVGLRNVWYDTAASTYLYKPAVFRAVLDIVGPAKVLWGSDYPVLGMGRFLRRCREEAGVRDDEAPRLFGENARRVYGLADRGADRA